MMSKLITQGRASTPTMKEVNSAIANLPLNLRAAATAYAKGQMSAASFKKEVSAISKVDPTAGVYLKGVQKLVDKQKESEKVLNHLTTTPVQNELSKLGVKLFDTSGKFVGMGGVISQLGPKLAKMKDQQEQLRITQLLFGSSNRKVLDTILAGKPGWDSAIKSVSDHKAITEASANSQNTFEANIKKVHHTIQDLQVSLGNALLPIMNKVMHVILGIVQPIAHWIEKNKVLVGWIFGIVGAITGLITVVWLVSKAVEGWKAVMALLDANPVTLIVIAIVLLVVALYELVKHWKTVWAAITKWASEAWNAIKGAWDAVWGWIKNSWDEMLAKAKIIFKALGPVILIILSPISLIIFAVKFLMKHWNEIWDSIKKITADAVSAIGKTLSNVIDFFAKLPGQIWNGIKDVGKTLHKWGGDIISGAVTGITNAASSIWNFFSSMPGKIYRFVSSTLGSMLHFGEDIIKNIIKGIGNMAKGLADAFGNVFKHIPGMSTVVKLAGSALNFLGLAEGGPVSSNMPYIVGEKGPELFVPNSSGKIIPNNALMGASSGASLVGGRNGGSGKTVIVNVTVSGQVYGSLNDFSRTLGKQLTSTLLPQAGVVLAH
jgi:phage-related minor tail protein